MHDCAPGWSILLQCSTEIDSPQFSFMINGFSVGGRLSDTILLVFPSPESPEAGSPDVA